MGRVCKDEEGRGGEGRGEGRGREGLEYYRDLLAISKVYALCDVPHHVMSSSEELLKVVKSNGNRDR